MTDYPLRIYRRIVAGLELLYCQSCAIRRPEADELTEREIEMRQAEWSTRICVDCQRGLD